MKKEQVTDISECIWILKKKVESSKVSDKHKIDILEALMDLRVTRKSPTKTINAKIRKLANE